MSEAPVRTVVVASPSARREGGIVLRAVVHILIWSSLLVGIERGLVRSMPTRNGAAPALGEVQFRDLDDADQRLFRQVGEGIREAEDARGRTGGWPSVESLAGRGIPPFAPDPIDRAGYRWRLERDGVVVNYLGVPAAASGRPTFAIVILEPDPGSPPDPQAATDEVHHKLKDGTMLHVSIWKGPGDPAQPFATPPIEQGWRRITMVSP